MKTSSALDTAIVRTLIYGDVFRFPMTAAEIHRYLIDYEATLETVQEALHNPSDWLQQHIRTGGPS